MNQKPGSYIHFIGTLILLIGILLLVIGMLCLFLTDVSFSWWLIVLSMVFDIVGITLMTLKPR